MKEHIPYEDFAKLAITIGEILSVEKIEDADKLLKLMVDVGEKESRQIISGIAEYFPEPEQLVGRRCPFVTNLQPRVIRGFESNGMILAVSTENNIFSLLHVDDTIPPGSRIS